jgi:hypothetical protein
MVLLYQSPQNPVTQIAGQYALLESSSLLKLMLSSLHSASSETLLEAPSDYKTVCCCFITFIFLIPAAPKYPEMLFDICVIAVYRDILG